MKNKDLKKIGFMEELLKKFFRSLPENENAKDGLDIFEKFFQGLPTDMYQEAVNHLMIYGNISSAGNLEHAGRVLDTFIARYEKIWRAH